MANVLVENKSLEDIAAAIRSKNGESTTYTPGEMAGAITNLPEGGGSENQPLDITSNGTYTAPEGVGYSPVVVNVPQDGAPTAEELTLTGDCSYRFAHGGWDWFIKKYGNQITTKDIEQTKSMFYGCKIDKIPFEINAPNKQLRTINVEKMFGESAIKQVPKINNIKLDRMDEIFAGCQYIREYPEDIDKWFNWDLYENATSEWSGSQARMIERNYSLRKFPYGLYKHGNPLTRQHADYYRFYWCCCLDEIVNLPNSLFKAEWDSDSFYLFVSNCRRLARLTFAPTMTNGQPNNPKWKSQVIDLTMYIGYSSKDKSNILNYNSGITADKEVKDDATYQALKNDPDWFATNKDYSRYNHTSAVETINSLPDTSAYLATAGGTNTIKFQGECGSKTDGGAINTLTPEEIAVAAARGWTVTLV